MTENAGEALGGFIAKLAMHSRLTPREIDALRGLPATEVAMPAHRDFVSVSQSTDHSYCVASGMVGRYSQDRNGMRQITALHIPGDMADLCSAVFPRSSWTFQTLAPSKLLRIPHDAIREVGRCHPGIAEAFWRDCVVDMSVMSEGMMTLGRRNGEAKTAHLLCELSCRIRRAGIVADDRFEWHLRQGDVAEIVGLTSVHVNRMLRSLRQRGLATVSGKTVEIHDFTRLAKLADFDPTYLHL